MEAIIKELLLEKVIRDNISSYSWHALLVKKKDTAWRLVNDFKELNAHTV